MKIKDSPDFKTKPKPITFSPEDYVRDALEIMCEKNIGSIIIVDPENKLLGIVTERDMMIRVLGKNKNPDETKLSEIMTTKVRFAYENDNMVDWIHTMSDERFRHLPIVDNEGKIVNMMSQGDFLAHTFPDLYEAFRKSLKDRLGKSFQIALILFALITLILIGFGL